MKDVIRAGFFADAINPTDDELVRWAYIDGAHYPPEMPQDWSLCVTEPSRREMLVRIASDVSCPNRKFFLSCLYLLVGDAVRTRGSTWSLEAAARWLREPHASAPEDVQLFFRRAVHLIDTPQDFDYGKWCGGGYAYRIPNAE